MSKIAFSKFGLKKSDEIKKITINEQEVEVKQHLSVMEKLTLISNVINEAADENNFENPVKTKVFTTLEILNFYTNITFTDKQKEDPAKIYDLINQNRFMDNIIDMIPEEEYKELISDIKICSECVYKYRNSIYGLMDGINNNYKDLNGQASEIQSKLNDPDNLSLLRDVLTKLG